MEHRKPDKNIRGGKCGRVGCLERKKIEFKLVGQFKNMTPEIQVSLLLKFIVRFGIIRRNAAGIKLQFVGPVVIDASPVKKPCCGTEHLWLEKTFVQISFIA